MLPAYNGDNDVSITSEGTGIIGGDIDVAVRARGDLKVGQIDAGRGDIRLDSLDFDFLTAEQYGETHLIGNNINIGGEQTQWQGIGSTFLPLRIDSSGAVKFVSFTYFEPEFVGSIPHFVATGDRLQSIASAQATQGLKSAMQNAVDDQAQVDEGIFTEVSPYSTGVDSVYTPELSLVGSDLVPTARDEEEEEERQPSQDEPLEL